MGFLREQPQHKLSFIIGIKCGWYNTVSTWIQLEAVRDFTCIGEGVRSGSGFMVQEEVFVQSTRYQISLFNLSQVLIKQ